MLHKYDVHKHVIVAVYNYVIYHALSHTVNFYFTLKVLLHRDKIVAWAEI